MELFNIPQPSSNTVIIFTKSKITKLLKKTTKNVYKLEKKM